MQLHNIILLAGLSAFATASAVPAVFEQRALTYSCPYVCGPRPKSTVKSIQLGPLNALLGLGSVLTADVLPVPPVQRLDGFCCSGPATGTDIALIKLGLGLIGLNGLTLVASTTQKKCVLQSDLNFGCAVGKAYCCNSYLSSSILGFYGIDCVPSVLG